MRQLHYSQVRPSGVRASVWALSSLALLGIMAGCGGGASESSQKAVAVGPWGKEDFPQVALTVTAKGATLLTSSISGVISKRMTVDGNGRFEVTGTVTPGGGGASTADGATVIGNPSSSYPVHYIGTANGGTMTLTIIVSQASGRTSTVDSYTLTYGKVVTIDPPA